MHADSSRVGTAASAHVLFAACGCVCTAAAAACAELYGSDLSEAAQIDMVLEAAADLRAKLKVRGVAAAASTHTLRGLDLKPLNVADSCRRVVPDLSKHLHL
jgi:hypothetical protein